MIEKRLVQWYAHDAGVDLDIAEREIVLAYSLKIFHDGGLLNSLAFKGGTAIRKLFMGNTGRFSLDLDFTAIGDVTPDDIVLELVHLLDGQSYYDLTFSIAKDAFYVAEDSLSCGAEVSYSHQWTTSSRFDVQISFRAPPLLPVKRIPLLQERYFEWMDIDIPNIPGLDLLEVIGEKIRAAAQRSRVRDLYDLYQLGHQPFDREIVRRIAIIKCWETRFSLEPASFLDDLPRGRYDWPDLTRLVRSTRLISAEELVNSVQKNYAFLQELSAEETRLDSDPYGREHILYKQMVNGLSDLLK